MIAPDSSVVIAALAPWHEAHHSARAALVESVGRKGQVHRRLSSAGGVASPERAEIDAVAYPVYAQDAAARALRRLDDAAQ